MRFYLVSCFFVVKNVSKNNDFDSGGDFSPVFLPLVPFFVFGSQIAFRMSFMSRKSRWYTSTTQKKAKQF
jgi:hypothetical protein